MTLAGAPIVGRFTVNKSGHSLNQRFLAALLATPGLLDCRTPARSEPAPPIILRPRVADLLEEAFAL
jgi:UDP-3-O-acyl-N-acetylglucosamine deacetylase